MFFSIFSSGFEIFCLVFKDKVDFNYTRNLGGKFLLLINVCFQSAAWLIIAVPMLDQQVGAAAGNLNMGDTELTSKPKFEAITEHGCFSNPPNILPRLKPDSSSCFGKGPHLTNPDVTKIKCTS